MAFWANFATAHGKPVSFAEWALVASGASMSAGGEGKDDPYYIQHMHDWFTTHPTAFEIYFDRTATDGDHQLNGGKFPQAAALYRQLFAAPSTTPTASATAYEVRIRHAEQHRNAEQHADGDPVQHGPQEFERNGVEHRVDHRFQQRLGHGVGRPVRLVEATATATASGEPSATPSDTSSALPSSTPAGSAPAPSSSPSGSVSPPPAEQVQPPASTAVRLRVSAKSNRSSAHDLSGRTVRASVYVFAEAKSGASVSFYLDDANHKRAALHVEHTAPFDSSAPITARPSRRRVPTWSPDRTR